MSVFKIITYPHKDLRKVASPVSMFDETLQQNIQKMFKTLYTTGSWTLTAPQVGISDAFFVMDISSEQNQPMYFINPKIRSKTGSFNHEQPCLSFPGVALFIPRATHIELEYQDDKGNIQIFQAEQLAAFSIQHAVEQLSGIRLVDHLSKLKKERFLKKYNKLLKDHHHGCGDVHCHEEH